MLLIVVVSNGLAQDAHAAQGWGSRGVAVTDDSLDQAFPVMCAAPRGEVIVAWQQLGRIYTQKLTRDGGVAAGWPAHTGVALTPAAPVTPFQQCRPRICTDGEGGAYVVWNDGRESGCQFGCFVQNRELYLQHVTAHGALDPRWGPSGIRVGSVPTPSSFTSGGMRIRPLDQNPEIVPDGRGGVLIAWLESPPFSADSVAILRAQRVSSSGETLWAAGGLAACRMRGEHRFPSLWPDGAGGACVVWEENPPDGSPMTLWGQHVTAAGEVSWGPEGRAIAVEPAGNSDHRVASDSLGGAITIWSTTQNGRTRVLAKRFSTDGTPIWGPSFTVADSAMANPEPSVAIGAAGMVWTTWLSPSKLGGVVVVSEIPRELDATRPNSVLLGDTMAGAMSTPRIVDDACGGAFVSWLEGTFAPRVSHVTRDGSGVVVDGDWSREGSRLDDAVGGAHTNEALASLPGQAFIAWGHRRDLATGDDEIRLQLLCRAGVGGLCTAVPGPPATSQELTIEHVAPNPALGSLTVSFALACETDVEVEVMDIAGRRRFARRLGRLPAGPHTLPLGTELPALAGSYLIRLRSHRHSVAKRIVLIR